jgi:transmembrane sensor
MTRNPTEQHLEDAAAWLIRLNEADTVELRAELRAEHGRWLARDAVHEMAWNKVSAAWSVADAGRPTTMAAWPMSDPSRAETAGNVHALPQRPRQRLLPVVAMLAAACAALAIALPQVHDFGADHSTATAEIRTVTLADGSSVSLGAKSAIAVEITPAGRSVKLLSGRAFFDVAKDVNRPFVVQAGEAAVTVLGTAFDVGLSEEVVSVAVKRGLVGVRYDEGATHIGEQVAPGSELVIRRDSGVVTRQSVPTAEIGSWSDGRLFVENATIADVVAELRRYHRGWILLGDDRIGQLRVTGLYNLHQPEQALRAMLLPVGGSMRQITPLVAVLSAPERPISK